MAYRYSVILLLFLVSAIHARRLVELKDPSSMRRDLVIEEEEEDVEPEFRSMFDRYEPENNPFRTDEDRRMQMCPDNLAPDENDNC
ncbi:hypothetical protein CBL_00062 [Carabus blaptoides fortunei]